MKIKFVLLAILIVLSADRASACMCLPVSACESYEKAPAIFIASVTEVDPPRNSPEALQYAHLSIAQTFKGKVESKVRFLQGSPGIGCSFIFEKGATYLLYAAYDEESKTYHTNTCSRSSPLAYAAEDLDYLRGLPGSSEATRLSGSVVKYDYEGAGSRSVPELIKGVKVTAEGEDGRRFEAITNDEGFYKIVGLPSGRYKVTAQIPEYLSLDRESPPFVEVPGNGCVTAGFLTRTDGRISGVLVDSKGQVAPGIYVDLVPFELAHRAGDRGVSRNHKTDNGGQFEFTELRPGRYLLGVNLRREPDGGNPFRRTYFPGVSDVAEAKVIVLGRGEKLNGHRIRLPPRLPVRIIRGRFVWPDGKPVTRGRLEFKDTADSKAGQSLDLADVDRQGNFSLRVLEGIEGWVHGSVMIPVESGLDVMVAEPVRIGPNSKPGPIKLVVTRKTDGGVRILR
ncbi:MAG TPA: hypothetical protein VJU84_01790 [Pyrinomonadaceae bacterium]|nr:hypothetical protein [Pyrinomonadaceae bacterium]